MEEKQHARLSSGDKSRRKQHQEEEMCAEIVAIC